MQTAFLILKQTKTQRLMFSGVEKIYDATSEHNKLNYVRNDNILSIRSLSHRRKEIK